MAGKGIGRLSATGSAPRTGIRVVQGIGYEENRQSYEEQECERREDFIGSEGARRLDKMQNRGTQKEVPKGLPQKREGLN